MASYSGLWNNEYGENYSPLGSDVNIGNGRTALSRVFANRLYSRGALRELLSELLGAAAGETAVSSHKRVKAERDLEANVLGGKRTIETFIGVNRPTTADDVVLFDEALHLSSAPNYVGDSSGNGGGGKLGW